MHTPFLPTPSPAQAPPSKATSRITEPNTLGMVWGSSRDAGYRIGVDHLRAYTAAEGHANVPRRFVTDDGFTLGTWVNSRRREHRADTLSANKITELNTLGMVWDPRDVGYQIGVVHLRAYTAAQGNANVPAIYVADDGFTLGEWVGRRRKDRRAGRLSAKRVTELNALGMMWGPSRASYAAGYRIGVAHLRAYAAVAEGHANMPATHVADDGFKLGAWVANRRHDHKVGRLSMARIAELDTLGMVWGSSRDAGYRIGLDHLRVYTATAGHANIPSRFVTDDGFKLGKWVANRRQDRTIGRLSTARIAELNTLRMVWDPRAE